MIEYQPNRATGLVQSIRSESMRYTNPIIPGFYPDPSLCRVGYDFYLVTSSFEYFPGIPIFHSRDLVHWRQIGYGLTRPEQMPVHDGRSSGGIFAPTIRFNDGKFYIITTNVNGGGNFIISASDPAGEWSDPLWLEQGGIDPSLFFDDDGRVYFSGTNGGRIVQREIDPETGQFLSPEVGVWDGTGGQYPEAPHLYKIGGLYYLMISEGGTEYGHMVTIARSSQAMGPFESCPHNPVLSHRSIKSPLQVTGHADWVQLEDGSWWLVCLGVRPNGYPPCYHLGRETFLTPLTWDSAGWPVVGEQGRLPLEADAPQLPPQTWPADPSRDDFDLPVLGLSWNFVRTHPRSPEPSLWSLSDRPGWLRLAGTCANLASLEPAALIVRRQQHFDCRAAALLEFEPQSAQEEAGLTVRMNERHHYEIARTVRDGQPAVIVRRQIGSLSAEVACQVVTPGALVLEIHATPDHYQFGFRLAGQEWRLLADGETRYLSTEVAGGFTGVFFGLYATGNGQPCPTPAFFDWFDYQP
jgi:xylan 1,4-beta-xylosidase